MPNANRSLLRSQAVNGALFFVHALGLVDLSAVLVADKSSAQAARHFGL